MMSMFVEVSMRTIVTNSTVSGAEKAVTECLIYSYGMLTMSMMSMSNTDKASPNGTVADNQFSDDKGWPGRN